MEYETDVFGYSRKSPDDKEDTEKSIKNQDELIEIICKGKNWRLMEIISDKNISGSDNDRKGIKEDISKARKHKVMNPKRNVYIVVKDSKRFSRDSSWAINTLKDLNAYGIKVFSIMENSFLDPADLGMRIMANVNEQAIYDGKKNARITQELKMAKNLPCIPPPFGYQSNFKYNSYRRRIPIDKSKDITNWVIVPKEAEIIKEVINDYLRDVNYKETLSSTKIDKGIYYRIISNAKKGIYNGIIKFENKIRDSNKIIIRTDVIEYPGTYEHILSEEVFKNLYEKN